MDLMLKMRISLWNNYLRNKAICLKGKYLSWIDYSWFMVSYPTSCSTEQVVNWAIVQIWEVTLRLLSVLAADVTWTGYFVHLELSRDSRCTELFLRNWRYFCKKTPKPSFAPFRRSHEFSSWTAYEGPILFISMREGWNNTGWCTFVRKFWTWSNSKYVSRISWIFPRDSCEI